MARSGLGVPARGRGRPGKDLERLLAYERDRPDQALTEALLELRLAPEDAVGAAADRLLRDQAPWALDLAGAAEAAVQAAGDERDRRVFTAWSLHPGGVSQTELAGAEGVSAQRIGQIASAAGRRVRVWAERHGPLRWAAATLADRLGGLSSLEAVDAQLEALGAVGEPAAGLLLWLGGPFTAVPGRPGWLAAQPREAVGRTAACLSADGGVRRLEDVRDELAGLRVGPGQLEAWLAASGAVVVHDLVVSVARGGLADALERLLDAHGRPRRADELAAELAGAGRPVETAAVAAALRHRRFTGSPDGPVGLAAWGDAPTRPTEKRSTARPAGPPVKAGKKSKPSRAAASDHQWLAVTIDADALRGGDGGVSAELMESLGLQPPLRRTFSSRWGPVSLAYEGGTAVRGSVRAVALAAGARLGDTLLLGFSPSGELAVKVEDGGARRDGEPSGPAAFSR